MGAFTSESWRRVAALFERVVDLPPAKREAALDRECPDAHLRRELERLLHAHDTADQDFLTALDTERAAALLDAEREVAAPETIGPYRIVRRLGGGGMGTVYLAHDARLGRAVAIKLLHTTTARGAARDRLIAEARAAGGLDHPNTVPLHEIGETADGRLYLIMAYAGDRTLADRLRLGPLPVAEAAALGARVAAALAAAHRLGIVHRDVKPSNVILSEDGRPRLVDFGIAAVAGSGSAGGPTPGTVPYMSPEQTRGAPADHRTDVWSLGVVLYEMLTGQRPFRGADDAAVIRAIHEQPVVPVRDLRPDVPVPFAALVERCLAGDPAERPPGAEALTHDLEACAAAARSGEGADGRPGSRHRAPAWIAAAVATLGLAGLAIAGLREADPSGAAETSAATLAILPFAPVDEDSALHRLGRELVVTLSSRLDGVGELRVVEPLTVLGRTAAREQRGVEAGAALARELGAGRLVYGRLTRSGDSVRLDAALRETGTMRVVGRAVAMAPAGDLAALTDSAALGLLRAALGSDRRLLPTRTALATSSIDALQAFVDGELAIAGARFRAAPAAFERAIRADSTFWLAYWRYMYARGYHGLPVDSAVRAAVYEHRSDLPEADRLLVEARMTDGNRSGLALRREATVRHPTYWPAWFDLGDQLVHNGVFLGEPFHEARRALERSVQLNPRFVPGWSHLFWIAVHQRDTAASGAVLRRLDELRFDSLMADEWGLGTLDLYVYLDHLARTGGEPDAGSADLGARMLAGYSGQLAPERLAVSLANYGFFRAQLDMAERVRRLDAPPPVLAAQHWSDALSWAGRGRWDSTLVSLRRYVRAGTRPEAPLWAYGLAATGAWAGLLSPDSAAALHDAAARVAGDPGGRAELAWLDGLLACARGDRDALEHARRRLAAIDADGGAALRASLAAMATAAAGRPAEAGAALAALELASADAGLAFRIGARHPFITSVDRIAAAYWLLEAGDTAGAAPFLRLHETDLPGTLHPLPTVQVVFGTHLLHDLASVLERQGRAEEAAAVRANHAERVGRAASMPRMRPCAAAAPAAAAP